MRSIANPALSCQVGSLPIRKKEVPRRKFNPHLPTNSTLADTISSCARQRYSRETARLPERLLPHSIAEESFSRSMTTLELMRITRIGYPITYRSFTRETLYTNVPCSRVRLYSTRPLWSPECMCPQNTRLGFILQILSARLGDPKCRLASGSRSSDTSMLCFLYRGGVCATRMSMPSGMLAQCESNSSSEDS